MLPVVAVDDVIGLVLQQVGAVVQGGLRNDLGDALEGADDGMTFVIGHVGEALVTGDGRVGQQADGHVAKFGGAFDDVEVAWVDEVGAHANVYSFIHDLA